MNIMMKENKIILNDVKELLNNKYPNLIDKIILFGSQVIGTAREYSDYDFLIIFKNNITWKTESNIIDDFYEIDLKYDIVTDVKVISSFDLKLPRGKQQYIKNALKYGVCA